MTPECKTSPGGGKSVVLLHKKGCLELYNEVFAKEFIKLNPPSTDFVTTSSGA